jgi:hypothetical protein
LEEHAKTPAEAETRMRNNKIHTNKKGTGENHNITRNSHQTNTQEDKDQSYVATGTTGRTADLET